MGVWFKSARRQRQRQSKSMYRFETLEPRRLLSALPFTAQQVNFTVGPIVADPTRDLAYVADQSDSKVIEVDTLSGTTSAVMSTIGAPTAMAVSANGNSLLVFEKAFGYLEVFALPSLKETSNHALNYTFTSIAQSRSGQFYGATNSGIVELSNLYAYVQTLSTNGEGAFQPDLKMSADGDTLYALDTNLGGSNAVDLFDVSTAAPTLTSQVSINNADALDFAVSSTTGNIFSAVEFTDGINATSVASGTTSTYAFSAGGVSQYSDAVAASPGGATVFGASANSPAEIDEFDQSSGAVINEYQVGGSIEPQSLAITPNGHVIYVGENNTLGLIGNSQMNVSSTGENLVDDNGSFVADGFVTESAPSADATTGVVGAIVYDDINNNGVLDAGDISTTVTQSNGNYGFSSLPGNTATLRLIMPVGFVTSYGSPSVLTATSGQSFTDYDFSLYKTNTVTGLIYNDANGNGRRDATESGIANIRVYADLNYNGLYDTGEPSALTDSTGLYSLAGLHPAAQSSIPVKVVQPAGDLVETATFYLNSESGLSTTFTTGVTSQSYVAGEVSRSLGNAGTIQAGAGQVVYLDYNNDGLLDNNEPSTVTDGYGNYSIGNLATGSVTVRVQPLTGFTTTAGQTSTVTLNVTSGIRYAANFIVTAADSSTIGEIAGQAYNDANSNGLYDPAELPLQGRTIYIDSNNNGVFDTGEPTTVTDSSGNYFFSGLTAGNYEVRLNLPSGLAPTVGSQSVTLRSGVNGLYTYPGVNFGSPAYTGTVTGEVYSDVNDNGVLDSGEPGLYGRTVYVDANNNGVLDSGELSTTTDANGKYTLSGVPVGNAIIRQVLPSGSTGSPAYFSVSVPYNQTITANFGSYAPMASIYGLVFNDINGNEVQDAGDQSISGRTVYLDLNNDGMFDAGDVSMITNANGYAFNNLAAGTYTVRQLLPAGWQQTTATVPNSIANGATARILLGANQPVPTANAGGPYVIGEGGGAGLSAGASTDTGNGHIVLYEWDLNYNGSTFNPTVTGVTTTFMATGLDGPSTRTVAVRVTDNAGNTSIATAVVSITDVPPTAGFIGSTAALGSAATVSFTNPFDPSPADVAAGFMYDFDFNNDGTFELIDQTTPTATVPASYLGTVGVHTIRGRILDKDGGFSDYTANITVIAATGATIAGTVTGGPAGETIYLDANNNGVLDTGERSTTTAAGGAYSFSAVTAGAYVIRQQLPITYLQTSPANVAGIAVTVSSTSTVTGENFVDKAAAIVTTVSGAVTGGPIGEMIYLDTNNNSKLDTGELSTTTSANGTYTFSNVPTGATIIRQVLPAGYSQTTPAGGLGIHVTVTASSNLTNENFADKSVATTGSISGNITGGPANETVYLDANNNGVLDSGELSTVASTANLTGFGFVFANVPAGSYVLRQVLPTGYTQTSPTGNAGLAVTVSAGTSLTAKNFTDAVASTGGSISGVVTGSLAGETIYLDTNNNAKLDTGELSTTTTSTGTYSFSNVPVGATIVRQVLPTGYTQTAPSGGLGIHVTVTGTSKLTNENFTDKAPAVVHTKLTGTTIGTAGSNKNSGNTITKATDGSTSTFFDGAAANGNWVGLDLGSATSISQIAYAPRSGYASRMTGGQIQISTTADFSSGVTTIYTITGTPPSALTTVTLTSPVTARYVRYLSPAGSYGNISEFQVFS